MTIFCVFNRNMLTVTFLPRAHPNASPAMLDKVIRHIVSNPELKIYSTNVPYSIAKYRKTSEETLNWMIHQEAPARSEICRKRQFTVPPSDYFAIDTALRVVMIRKCSDVRKNGITPETCGTTALTPVKNFPFLPFCIRCFCE